MAAWKTLAVGVMVALATAAVAVGVLPETVSPGGVGAVARVAGACPSFSWGAVEGSRTYELVVYELSATAEGGRPVLTARIPGSALSWTPSLDECLEPGGRYVWFVRSLGSKSAGGWSEGRAFEIEEGPTIAEVVQALRVLERFVRGSEERTDVGDEGAGDEILEPGRRETELSSPTEEPQALTTGVEIAETAITIGGADVVTTATDQDTLGGMSCADGQLAKWHAGSSSWVCGAYQAGNQLFLDIDMFHVEEGSGSDLDADLLDGYDSVDFAQLAAASAFTANPLNETVSGGPLYINPASGVKEDYTLIGAAVAGAQRFRVDIEGDVELSGSINKGLRVAPDVVSGLGFASPNVLAGHWSNQVTTGVAGAGIGGGGAQRVSNGTLYGNVVTDDFGSIGGGLGNRAGDAAGTTSDKRHATVGGGSSNVASGWGSTVGGGVGNDAGGDFSSVGGGSGNDAAGLNAVISGGLSNDALTLSSSIGGGESNDVTDRYGVVDGGAYNVAGDGAGTVSDEEFAVVGGGYSNEARAKHAVIGGGFDNLASDRYGTIGGGSENQAGDAAGTTSDRPGATVAGGTQNVASGSASSIGGGGSNTASGHVATIGGGSSNNATGDSATIGGGGQNTASGTGATVGGGELNSADAAGATVGGGDSNSVTDNWSVVSGGAYNLAGDDAGTISDEQFAVVGGGFSNEARANYGVILGGKDNLVTDQYGTIGGGFENRAGDGAGTTLDRKLATVAGGGSNSATGFASTVGGGNGNDASGFMSTISGGSNNEAAIESSTVGGGQANRALAATSTVAGGESNNVWDTGGTIGGGSSNSAGDAAGGLVDNTFATVAGGQSNTATGGHGSIAGGRNNQVTDQYGTVAGGRNNRAGDSAGTTSDRSYATVGGGYDNVASGLYATVPGGDGNVASGWGSFAAGRRASATHTNSFVWSSDHAFSTADEEVTFGIGSSFRIMRDPLIELLTVDATGRLAVPGSSGINAASFIKGTATPGTGAALEVANSTNFGEVAWFRQMDPDTLQPVLKLLLPEGIPGNQARSFLVCEILGASLTPKCHIDKNGTFIAGSDFAEALPALGERSEYEAGDLLLMSADGAGVEPAAEPYSPRIAGVYSTRPGVLGADKDGETRVDTSDVPVAIVGIVPTKVSGENGSIAVGDLLVNSGTAGHAMKGTDRARMQGAIVGKALEPFKGETGVIRVLVSLL